MARTHFVKKSQKATTCRACGQEIPVGSSYKWFKMKLTRGGVKKSYHTDCEIPASHRTTSRMGEIYDAQSALGKDLDAAEDFDGIREALEAFGSIVREVSEGYAESAQNIEDGFQHETYQSQELRERSEALESWADEIESWDFSGDEPDQDDFTKTDSDEYDNAVEAWEAEEPQRDSDDYPEGEEGDIAHNQDYDAWLRAEPSEHEYEIADEEAFNEAVEEVLSDARSEAQDVADNCPV